jgi:hypothetical protein
MACANSFAIFKTGIPGYSACDRQGDNYVFITNSERTGPLKKNLDKRTRKELRDRKL